MDVKQTLNLPNIVTNVLFLVITALGTLVWIEISEVRSELDEYTALFSANEVKTHRERHKCTH